MDALAAVWDDTDPEDVTSYTDTDLTYSRSWSTRLYDPTGEFREKAKGIRDHYELEYISEAIDFATRVGIAALIDSTDAMISRDNFDVNYTIPPRGWVTTNVRGNIEYTEESNDDEYIQVSMPPVCREMAEQMIEDGTVETKRELMMHGIDLLVGE